MAEAINEDFFETQAHHSYAKRRLLKRIIDSVAHRRFSKLTQTNKLAITYVDAFAGKGYFGDSELPNPNDDICKWGTPLIALAVFMKCIDGKLSKICKGVLVGGSEVHEVSSLFIFNDLNHKVVLMGFIGKYLKENKNDFKIYHKDDKIELSKTYNSIRSVTLKIFIEFSSLKFENMAGRFQSIQGPVFSLLDPFGIKLPRDVVKLLMGKERDLLINFNVNYANRAVHNPKLSNFLDNNFGEDMKKLSLSDNIDENYDTITNEYKCLLKKLCQESTSTMLYTSSFTLKKGKRRPDNARLFDLIFATSSLSVLHDAKTSFQYINQKSGEGSFTDYYDLNGISIETGRKTSDEQESDEIYKKYCDRGSVKLGELKRMILEETPFPYHSRALKNLENHKRIQVNPLNKDGTQDVRTNKEICHALSHNPDDPDTEDKKYGNFWEVLFLKPE